MLTCSAVSIKNYRKSPRANKILQHYVLPDYHEQQTGYVKGKKRKPKSKPKSKKAKKAARGTNDMDLDSEDEVNGHGSDDDIVHNLSDDSMEEIEEDEQVLTMNNERFTVPEILFNPSDIGMDQAGISEAIVDAISSCDEGTYQRASLRI